MVLGIWRRLRASALLEAMLWVCLGLLGGSGWAAEATTGRQRVSTALNGVIEQPYVKKINMAYDRSRDHEPDTRNHYQTPSPPGWETYYGSRYTAERGYGWLTELRGEGRDRGIDASIRLPNGTEVTLRQLGRAELATYQERHQENRLLVFRIDLPNGWYRVACTSVDPDTTLPLVDQRSFKCRAHDVVFAGANYGAPLVVGGHDLVEGEGVVEVVDGHLRIVVGDPAYAGWTWKYPGPWYQELRHWWRREYNYYPNWYRRLTRTIDPGFHALRLNSLAIERVAAPATRSILVFRDFFHRDDHADINDGVDPAKQWTRVRLHPDLSHAIRTELAQTAVKYSSTTREKHIVGLLQPEPSPEDGLIRYSTRVSLTMGEGSQKHSGVQEAGLVLLTDPAQPTEFDSTFVGVAFERHRAGTMGWMVYRVGNGQGGYRTNLEVPDTALPITIVAGEYELIVEHDVKQNVLTSIRVNEVDITETWSLATRTQRLARGLYGIRSAMSHASSRVPLQQFYWYYRVEALP